MPQLLRMGLILAAFGLFSKILADVITRETIPFDRTILLAIHQHQAPWLDHLMQGVTWLGEAPILAAVTALAAVGFCFMHRWQALKVVLVTFILAESTTQALKYLVQRPRPELWDLVVHLHTFSFPSGHAMASTAVYGVVAYGYGRLYPRLKWELALLATLLVLFIGVSRLYLGVHWPTDVLGGFIAGGVILAGVIHWCETDC